MNPVNSTDTPAGPPDADAQASQRVRAQATDAAVKFEAHFIKQMIGQMRSSARALSAHDGESQHRIDDDMLDVADGLVADALAQHRAFGIANLMLSQVLPRIAPPAGADLSSAAPPSPISST